jgi:hypothetical protein
MALDDVDTSELPDEQASLAEIMERQESALQSDIKDIAIDHRKDFKGRVRDGAVSPEDAQRILDDMRAEYLPRYKAAIRERMATMRDKAQDVTLEENDWADIVDKAALPAPNGGNSVVRRGQQVGGSVDNESFEDSYTFVISDLAKEIAQRNEGIMSDDLTERLRGSTPDGERTRKEIDRASDKTIGAVATKAGSSAVTEGRDDVAQAATDDDGELTDGEDEGEKLYAQRNAVLDASTCDPCFRLDDAIALVGSKKYSRIAPPNECKGGHYCRCTFDYIRKAPQQISNASGDDDEVVLAPVDEEDPYVRILSWGHTLHPDGAFDVTEEWARQMVESFEYRVETYAKFPQIWRNHESGYRYGEIRDIEIREDGIHVLPFWIPPARKDVNDSFIHELSPSFWRNWTDPHTGREFGPTLKEVSFVGDGHLLDIDPASQPETATSPHEIACSANSDTLTIMPQDKDPTENMSDSMHLKPFGSWLEGRIDDLLTTSEEFAFRRDIFESLAEGTDMTAADLRGMVAEGKPIFPPDALMASVAETMGVAVEDIRAGDVPGLKADMGQGEPDEPEQPEQPEQTESGSDEEMRNESGSVDNAADEATDIDPEYVDQLERRVTEMEMKQHGVDCSSNDVDGLREMRRHAPNAYRQSLDVLAQGNDDTGDTDGDQIEPVESSARGASGDGASNPDPADIERALQDDGYEEGSEEYFKEGARRGHPAFQWAT